MQIYIARSNFSDAGQSEYKKTVSEASDDDNIQETTFEHVPGSPNAETPDLVDEISSQTPTSPSLSPKTPTKEKFGDDDFFIDPSSKDTGVNSTTCPHVAIPPGRVAGAPGDDLDGIESPVGDHYRQSQHDNHQTSDTSINSANTHDINQSSDHANISTTALPKGSTIAIDCHGSISGQGVTHQNDVLQSDPAPRSPTPDSVDDLFEAEIDFSLLSPTNDDSNASNKANGDGDAEPVAKFVNPANLVMVNHGSTTSQSPNAGLVATSANQAPFPGTDEVSLSSTPSNQVPPDPPSPVPANSDIESIQFEPLSEAEANAGHAANVDFSGAHRSRDEATTYSEHAFPPAADSELAVHPPVGGKTYWPSDDGTDPLPEEDNERDNEDDNEDDNESTATLFDDPNPDSNDDDKLPNCDNDVKSPNDDDDDDDEDEAKRAPFRHKYGGKRLTGYKGHKNDPFPDSESDTCVEPETSAEPDGESDGESDFEPDEDSDTESDDESTKRIYTKAPHVQQPASVETGANSSVDDGFETPG